MIKLSVRTTDFNSLSQLIEFQLYFILIFLFNNRRYEYFPYINVLHINKDLIFFDKNKI